MASPPPPPLSASSSPSFLHLIRTTLSYDTNLMLAAIITLLLVILFVLLLHLYTRWFLLHARHRTPSTVTLPRLHHRFTVTDTTPNSSLGLPSSLIAAIPLFVYKTPPTHQLECAICLSLFEEEEIGRKLPTCGHSFHVECIDMWLHSHSTCPVCRAVVHCNRSRKVDHVEVQIDYPATGDDELRPETAAENRENVGVATEESGSASPPPPSSLGESIKKLLSNRSSRSEGKVHPSSNVDGDESEER